MFCKPIFTIACVFISLNSFNANSALVSRLGGLAFYDTELDITWLADANLAKTTTFGLSDISTNGMMDWSTANSWISAMNLDGGTGYLGYDDWRLPTALPVNGSSHLVAFNEFSNNASTDYGYADSDGWVDSLGEPVSEMGYLYYVTLQNLGYCLPDDSNASGCFVGSEWGLINVGPFTNLHSADFSHWTGTTSTENSDTALTFRFDDGFQGTSSKEIWGRFTWAVRDGDVSVVPIPTTFLLLGSGFIGLIGIAKRKRNGNYIH